MKQYNIKVGQYHGYADLKIEIPEEIKFFYEPGVVGNVLNRDCQHYTTIVDSEKYRDWIDVISRNFCVWTESIGIYTLVSIHNLHNDTPIPTIDRQIWFKENGIDFGQFTFVTYDDDFVPINAYKIIDLQDEWKIDVVCVTLRDFFSQGEYYSIRRSFVSWTEIEPSPCASRVFTLKTFEGKKGKLVWNTIFSKAMFNFEYEPEFLGEEYDLLEIQKDALTKMGFESIEEFNDYLHNRKRNLEKM